LAQLKASAERATRRHEGASLRHRFLVLFTLIFLAGSGVSFAVVAWLSRDIVDTLGGWFALSALAAVLMVALALTVLIAAIVFDRHVLRRLTLLDAAARQICAGDYSLQLPQRGSDELSRLARTFQDMSQNIAEHTATLERQVEQRTRALERQAHADPLTGLLNRRGMGERIQSEKNRLEREGAKLGVLILDLDHFKKFNDSYGHDLGDQALVHAAKTIRGIMRSYDLCSRWGGEEFLVIVPHILNHNALTIVAEKLRTEINSRPITVDGGQKHLTVSIGGYFADPKENIDIILKAADNALAMAKQNGGDCTIVSEMAPPALH
jgi:diguanylate cyclase (GGDEF)-like protein